MTCSILVGGAWGDEGKGKCITYLCSNDKPSIIARAGVGPNAGHSVEFNGEKYGLRLTPSGFVHTDAKLMIGAGVLVNPDVLYKEFDDLAKYNVKERMSIDSRCAIITEDHMARDKSSNSLYSTSGLTKTPAPIISLASVCTKPDGVNLKPYFSPLNSTE
jgi:adenylosuccinate synthase